MEKEQLVVNGIKAPNVKVDITPATINTNIDMLNAAIDNIAKSYENVQYADDLEIQKKQMKEDRAALNKLSSAIDAEKIRIKKEASKEILSFEESFKTLIEKIQKPCKKIDAEIKILEQKQRDERIEMIKSLWKEKAALIPDDFKENLYNQLYEDKFLLANTSKKYISDIFSNGIQKYLDGIAAIESVSSEYTKEGIERFKGSLDLTGAIELMTSLTKQQKEAEERIKIRLEAEKQAAIKKAEDEANARIETEKKAVLQKAEAEKQAVLKKAEAEKQAVLKKAEAEKQAVIQKAEEEKRKIQTVSAAILTVRDCYILTGPKSESVYFKNEKAIDKMAQKYEGSKKNLLSKGISFTESFSEESCEICIAEYNTSFKWSIKKSTIE